MIGIDSDTLIKLTRAGAKEVVASAVEIVVSPEVKKETVDEGKSGGFPDAFEIERNIKRGLIKVVRARKAGETETIVRELGLMGGEAGVFRLFMDGKCKAVASGDQKFLDLIEALNIPFVTSSALIVYLWKNGKIEKDVCLKLMKKLEPMISDEEYQLALFELKGGS